MTWWTGMSYMQVVNFFSSFGKKGGIWYSSWWVDNTMPQQINDTDANIQTLLQSHYDPKLKNHLQLLAIQCTEWSACDTKINKQQHHKILNIYNAVSNVAIQIIKLTLRQQ